jgi:hypothetical protein
VVSVEECLLSPTCVFSFPSSKRLSVSFCLEKTKYIEKRRRERKLQSMNIEHKPKPEIQMKHTKS